METETPRPDAQRIDGTISIGEVRTGDVVFCASPSLLQDLFTRAGEPWRHVGMAMVLNGVPSIVEVAGPNFRVRPLADALSTVTEAAVGRIDSVDRHHAERAAEWCGTHLGIEQVYAWDDVILAGFIAVTRRFSIAEDQERLERMVSAAVSDLADHQRGRIARANCDQQSYSCSAFVVAAFLNAGYSIDFDLGRTRAEGMRPSYWELIRAGERPLRSACGSRITMGQGADTVRSLVKGMLAAPEGLIAAGNELNRFEWYRWASPGDIWRSPTISERLSLDL